MRTDEVLKDLSHKLGQLNLQLAQYWQEGLSQQELENLQGQLSLKFPLEIVLYYQWHNGLQMPRPYDFELFPRATILSIENSIETYHRLKEIDSNFHDNPLLHFPQLSENPSAILEYEGTWHTSWFPLFDFNGEEYWFTVCQKSQTQAAPIYQVCLEDRPGMFLAFDSLTSLLQTVVEAFEIGAYIEDEGGIVREVRSLSIPIINKYNPLRKKYLLKAVNNAQNQDDLLQVIVSNDAHLREKAAQALRLSADASVVAPLVSLLQHSKPTIRREIIQLLGSLQYASAFDAVSGCLRDRNEEVKYDAIMALGELGDQRGISFLSPLSKSQDVKTRRLAQLALDSIQTKSK